MKAVLIVFAGSGIGGALRYLVQAFFAKNFPSTFPLGTLVVNVAGCLLIGIIYGIAEKNNFLDPVWRLALATGLCGGFTTFSTFAMENITLLRMNHFLYFSAYILISVVIGIAATGLGILIAKLL